MMREEITTAAKGGPMKFKVLIHEAEDGGFWAKVPARPGCVTEADTRDELLANLREAIEGRLEVSAEMHASSEGRLEEVEV
jgi:predicted RNase H-like HicB family nuclease